MSEITHNNTRDTTMPETAKSRTSPLLDAGLFGIAQTRGAVR